MPDYNYIHRLSLNDLLGLDLSALDAEGTLQTYTASAKFFQSGLSDHDFKRLREWNDNTLMPQLRAKWPNKPEK